MGSFRQFRRKAPPTARRRQVHGVLPRAHAISHREALGAVAACHQGGTVPLPRRAGRRPGILALRTRSPPARQPHRRSVATGAWGSANAIASHHPRPRGQGRPRRSPDGSGRGRETAVEKQPSKSAPGSNRIRWSFRPPIPAASATESAIRPPAPHARSERGSLRGRDDHRDRVCVIPDLDGFERFPVG